jgi:hypothetical protein
MPVQDLTPQLRTRLSRLERWVGIFVTLATLLVLVGLVLYVRQTAQRKGWFLRKLPYFTFVDSAAGLKVGQPVKMMGFDIGEITKIEAQPPGDWFNVFVTFTVKEPHEGYIWTDSKARVVAGDFLGNRYIEVTKGTSGPPSYVFHPVTQMDLAELERHLGSEQFAFAQIFDAKRQSGLDINTNSLALARATGSNTVPVMDKSISTKWPAGIWVPKSWGSKGGRYEPFNRRTDKGYWVDVDEQPALTERLEKVANALQEAMPNVLDLTNHLQRVLAEAANAAAQADRLLASARPVVTNLSVLTAQMTNGPGAVGNLLLPTNLQAQLGFTLTNAGATLASANLLVTNVDARIAALATTLNRALEELAGITSNLHKQVDVNTNILGNVSKLVVDADDMVQGLKRHWLLRSAFKEKSTNAPSAGSTRRAVSPKDSR